MTSLSTQVHKPRRKRARRTPAEMDALREAIVEAVKIDEPTTIRSVFYRLVSMGAIQKTEREYKSAVVRLVGEMREAGLLGWGSITDGTRLRRKPNSFSSLGHALHSTQRLYRRALWAEQAVYVEVWAEKDAISGVVYDVTSDWDVPLCICRGYPSRTYLHNSALEMRRVGKPTWIYYLGDRDPSGVDIPRNVEEKLRQYAPGIDLHFVRLAVTEEQIEELELQTRPTKKSDSRSKNFDGESVEVDAIPPNTLRAMVRQAIEGHVDQDALERTRAVEEAERETLAGLAARFRGGRR